MAKVNVRVALLRAALSGAIQRKAYITRAGTAAVTVERINRELAACERRQRHLRRLEGVGR